MRRRSTGVFWRPYILLISCTAIIFGIVLLVNAAVGSMDPSASIPDIMVTLFGGLFLLFGGLKGVSIGQQMRYVDDRDIPRSFDLIEYIIFSSVFMMLVYVALRFLDIRENIGPMGLILSIFLGLLFWWFVLRD